MPDAIQPADVYARVGELDAQVRQLYTAVVIFCVLSGTLIVLVLAKMGYNLHRDWSRDRQVDRVLRIAEKHGELSDTTIRTEARSIAGLVARKAEEIQTTVPGAVVDEIARAAPPPWREGQDPDRRRTGHTPPDGTPRPPGLYTPRESS